MSKAALTRLTILQKSFDLVYRNGFQVTSIDDIIATTQVTKGAFFYHFSNKEEMGLAMINEIMYPGMYDVLVKPLLDSTDPAADIYLMMKHLLLEAPFFDVKFGCPAVNLIDEMASVNDSFRRVLNKLFIECQGAIQASIMAGKSLGKVREEVDPEQVACFVMAGYSGIRNMGKLAGKACYHTYLHELAGYLKRLS
jgi:TetR/AcrR family transcriptional repressor of nem operon